MKKIISFFLILFSIVTFCQVGDFDSKIKELEDKIDKQSQIISNQQKIIDALKVEIEALKKETKTSSPPLQEAPKTANEEEITLKSSGLYGSSSLMNPNISVVVNTFAYSSNLKKRELDSRCLEGFTTEHSEMQKGFNLDSAELYFYAPVDPYFNLYAVIPQKEDGAEVEEAYFLTTALPYGLQVKGGKFKSSFGRLNSQHSHTWDFVDAPLPYRAFIGEEGLGDNGISLNWLPSTPFYLSIGTELFQGNNSILFGKEAKNGPHACSFYAKSSFDCGQHSSILTGISILKGYTLTDTITEGSLFKGKSSLYDFEFTYKWKKSKYKGFVIQGEYMYRTQNGNIFDETEINTLKREQDGLYLQATYLFGEGRWRIGTRYDRLNLFKNDYILEQEGISFGKNPYRISAMVEYNPTEFSRIRFQYNNDKSYSKGRTNNEFILQFIFGIGAHAAHPF